MTVHHDTTEVYTVRRRVDDETAPRQRRAIWLRAAVMVVTLVGAGVLIGWLLWGAR